MWPGWVQDNSDGPLVPMVQLVPIENDVIPMVLLVNMHLIPMWPGWVQDNSDGPLVPVVRLVPIEKNIHAKQVPFYTK